MGNEQRKCKHGKWYVVKRLRLLNHLCMEHGLYPEYQTVDPTNPHRSWYYYRNSPELEDILDAWFARPKYQEQNQEQ